MLRSFSALAMARSDVASPARICFKATAGSYSRSTKIGERENLVRPVLSGIAAKCPAPE
jgi:hypothetical protein